MELCRHWPKYIRGVGGDIVVREKTEQAESCHKCLNQFFLRKTVHSVRSCAAFQLSGLKRCYCCTVCIARRSETVERHLLLVTRRTCDRCGMRIQQKVLIGCVNVLHTSESCYMFRPHFVHGTRRRCFAGMCYKEVTKMCTYITLSFKCMV